MQLLARHDEAVLSRTLKRTKKATPLAVLLNEVTPGNGGK